MPAPNPLVPSQAGLDLGLGSELQTQALNEILERRKRTMLAANQQPNAFGFLNEFVSDINAWTRRGGPMNGTGNTGGMALQALMGTGVMGG